MGKFDNGVVIAARTVRGIISKCEPDKIRLSLGKKQSKRGGKPFVVTIGEKIMADMRWMIGDRVVIITAPDYREGLVRRSKKDKSGLDESGSYAISSPAENSNGKAMRGTVKLALPDNLERILFSTSDLGASYIPKTIRCTDEGIQFTLY